MFDPKRADAVWPNFSRAWGCNPRTKSAIMISVHDPRALTLYNPCVTARALYRG